MRDRFLTVPKNKQGEQEYDLGTEHSENIENYLLPNIEFEFLQTNGVFGKINEECGILIDDYESETIRGDDLKQTEKIVSNVKLKVPEFYKAITLAISYNTMIGMDF